MWPVLFVCTLITLAAALVTCLGLRAERHRLRRELADADAQVASLQALNTQLEKDIAAARAKLDGLDDRFRSLATQVLTETSRQSQAQAEEKLRLREVAIKAVVDPIKEALQRYDTHVREIEKAREGAYHALRQQVTTLTQQQDQLRGETANLVKALRRPEIRGAWGHLQLERVAELAGLTPHVVFDREVTSADGTLRADMVVHLPGGREIVIDAKTPIDAFMNAVEAQDDAQRRVQMDLHVRQIESKVRELSSKRYQDHFKSADFVVMFIPSEGFLQPAVELKPTLMEEAMEKGVMIATPSTLVALLKAVAMGWREEKVAENAAKISELGRELHNRIGTAFDHLGRLGKALDSTVTHYNKLVGSVETSILPQSRRFKELGADSAKELPAELDKIDTQPRPPVQPELLPDPKST